MNDLANALLVLVLILNLFALGTSRIQSVIRIVAAQGALLGDITLCVHESPGAAVVASALALGVNLLAQNRFFAGLDSGRLKIRLSARERGTPSVNP